MTAVSAPGPARWPWAEGVAVGLAVTFLLWCAATAPAELRLPEAALPAYLRWLGAGVATAAAVTAILRFTPAAYLGGTAAAGALGAYASCLVVVAGPSALAGAAAVAAVVAWDRHGKPPLRPALLLALHGQGTLAGLYLACNLGRFLDGWPQFAKSMLALASWAGAPLAP